VNEQLALPVCDHELAAWRLMCKKRAKSVQKACKKPHKQR
jgi:hypothetical protein